MSNNDKFSEKDIETRFIKTLKDLHYTYREDIRNSDERDINFREKFNVLNNVNLSDNEFSRLKTQLISSDVFVCAKHLREVNTLIRDDETPLYYKLIDSKNWCKNSFEVVRQQHSNTQNSFHVYDVILLINGLPIVQVELKNFDISPRTAIQQIASYKSVSGNGYSNSLLCFIQFFVVSNGADTMYFANNNDKHFKFDAEERFLSIYHFADEKNIKIAHLENFSKSVLAKSTLGEIIYKYMVLVETEQQILMMRPYQIYAVKNIIMSIDEKRGNGYIWHTTGSGKTLTSFKASTLLADNEKVDKCLFVVDRKDLDYQTRNEFNKFQPNCVEENANTSQLVERLVSTDRKDKVIVTTIQKLALALKLKESDNANSKRPNYIEELKPLANKRIVFIFDECHRSQFGENNKAIKNFFPKSQLYGFTGTPIFEENAVALRIKEEDKAEKTKQTTSDIFENLLHQYTITDAIEDNNVLRFHIEYYGADENTRLTNRQIAKSILDKHMNVTCDRMFNAIFATSSISEAIEYYGIFKQEQEERKQQGDYLPLNIACVFSPPAEVSQIVRQMQEDLENEIEDYKSSDETEVKRKKAKLNEIIADYNIQFGSNHTMSDFDKYYKDVQERIKSQQYANSEKSPQSKKIDITIVVDMLLTGFDSKYLNTLYVDKNLKYHGLIQAFSRTNRVLNSNKPFGNILDFRNQQNNVDDAIMLFSGKSADEARKIWFVEKSEVVLQSYKKAVDKLESFMQEQDLKFKPSEVVNIKGDIKKAEFVRHFKEVQKLKARLEQYTDLTSEQEQAIGEAMPLNDYRSFRSMYLDVAKMLRDDKARGKAEDTIIDAIIDSELVLFNSVIIDYDYIMSLMSRFTNPASEMTRQEVLDYICSDSKFIDSRADLSNYLDTLNIGDIKTEEEIKQGFIIFKNREIERQLQELAIKYGVNFDELKQFFYRAEERRILDSDELLDLFEPQDLGWQEKGEKEYNLIQSLRPIWNKLTKGQEISGLSAYEE